MLQVEEDRTEAKPPAGFESSQETSFQLKLSDASEGLDLSFILPQNEVDKVKCIKVATHRADELQPIRDRNENCFSFSFLIGCNSPVLVELTAS